MVLVARSSTLVGRVVGIVVQQIQNEPPPSEGTGSLRKPNGSGGRTGLERGIMLNAEIFRAHEAQSTKNMAAS